MPVRLWKKKKESALAQEVARALAHAALQALQQLQNCSKANRASFWLGFWSAARALVPFIPVRPKAVEREFDDEMEKLL